MKLRKIFLLTILTSPVVLINVYARDTARSLPKNIEAILLTRLQKELSVRCKLTYTVSVPGDTRWVRLTALTPESVPDIQKINRVEYSMNPVRFFRINGYRYAEFMIYNPGRIEKLEVTIHADLYRYDLQTAMENREKSQLAIPGSPETVPDVNAKDERKAVLDDFLKEEKYIEKDDRQIRAIAKSITGSDEIEIVKGIYNYVLDNMEYLVQGKKDLGAISALLYKKGDCSEYSDLFVAICRAKNIPARVVTGIAVQSDTKTAKHNWAEVYLQKYGWVPFDPSKGDAKFTALRDRLFNNLEPTYLYFSHLRNDVVLQNYHYCTFTYFGDPVSVTDSVEFEFPKKSD